MKINVIETMHSLSNRKYEELCHYASREGIEIPTPTCSKVELITLIIAHRIENSDSPINERTRYRFQEYDGTEHYIMLTPEQERFMRWNHNNAVDYDNMKIDILENIDWETP